MVISFSSASYKLRFGLEVFSLVNDQIKKKSLLLPFLFFGLGKYKIISLQVWRGPDGSKSLGLPEF